ncbi:2,4-dienoyl-CoA reductase [Desulfatibacillum alkenivorans DSM 16219]|jgi:2,4-dienoyl-CoA reductase-like NADH-dependent reductase (Old Yellow Enzyme family)|uniref:2,4-dienoyl-CoA reductase n=1 Tax=Desulfatibacillum alkenivorans DSM 16219 TaxID=1121393 RepID=A0A1M6EKU1_9BACT|nr:NADH:flavin oxidoreductase [Desulfatibacillum alkenivorans]SHI86155.1 2,4-dienoyl-CoA reductase [Desulfatibacillum alkenivorans DSM 16219]
MSYSELFDPIEIGNVTIKNRIAMAPMNPGLAGPNGYHTDTNTAWYATRARGGFGLIITECCVMNPHRWNGSEILNPSMFSDYRYYRYHSEMVQLIHEYNGCKIFMQLSPGWGRQGHPHVESPDCPSGAPSAIPLRVDFRNLNKGWEKQTKRISPALSELVPDFDVFRKMNDEEYAEARELLIKGMMEVSPDTVHLMLGDTPRELTIPEIVDLEDRFAVQANDAYMLGYDGIEVHAPHGYLLHSFLSPRSNQRHDEYGGSLENRARFLLNIIEKTRKKIGPDKAFGVRLSGDDLMPGGITHDEVKKVVEWCTAAGANFFNISQGSYENPGAAFAPDGENDFLRWAPGFKESSGGLPVITPNYIKPETACEALRTGHTDLISLGRQAIADPFWPAKVKEGREKDIVRCVRCQRCYMNLMISHWLECTVNPTAGREKHYPELWINTPSLDKKIDRFKGKAKGLAQI